MRFLRLCTFIIATLGSLTNRAQTVTIIGPTTANVNESKNYIVEFRNENNQAIVPPNGTFTWTAYTGQVTTSSASSATVLWSSSGMIEYEMQASDNTYYYGYLNVTVSDPIPPDPVSANYTYTYTCGNTIATRGNAPPNGANYQWWWQTTANGTSTTLGNAASITLTSTTNLYLRARLTASPFSWSANSQLIGTVPVYSTPPAAATQANHGAIIGTGSVSLSVGAVAGATSYAWYSQPTGGVAISGVNGVSYTPSVTSSTTFYVATKNPGCENASRLPVTATVYPIPVIASNPGTVIAMGLPVTLSASNFTYDSYSWKLKNSGGTYVQVSTNPTYSTTVAGEYQLTVTKGNAVAFTAPTFILSYGVDAINKNLIAVNDVLVPNIKTTSSIRTLTVEQNSQVIQYFDGLGRLIQTVSTQGSPSKADLVSPVFYDGLGRESKKYLPVSIGNAPSAPNGWYKPNLIDLNSGAYINQALTSYNNPSDKIADDTRPFSETVFEASPLNRPLQSFGPGQQWKDNNKSVAHGYLVNADGTAAGQERIIAWDVDTNGFPVKSTAVNTSVSGGYYLTGQLSVKSTKDEQGNEVREYLDKEGHTILKKVQVFSGTPQTNNDSHWAQTYYIYDVLGNLRVVLPPEAVKAITAN